MADIFTKAKALPWRTSSYFQLQEAAYDRWSYSDRPMSPESFYIGKKEISEHYSKHVAADLSYHNFLDAHWNPTTKKMALQASQGLREPSKSPFIRGYLERGYSWLATKGRWKTGVGILAGALAVNSFSGFDDNYNTIEGFQELGLSAAQRKIITDFGSGFDPIRQLARTMGVSFEKLVSKRGFRQAIQGAEVVERLGQGRFGEVFKMKGVFKTGLFRKKRHEFEFVKKIGFKKEEIMAGFGGHDTNMSEFLKQQGGVEGMIATEAKYQQQFGETFFAPSVYSQQGREIYMELMPGQTLYGLMMGEGAGIEAIKQGAGIIEKQMIGAIKKVAKKGFINQDIHLKNVIYDPKTERLSWIDYGMMQEQDQWALEEAWKTFQKVEGDIPGKAGAVMKAHYQESIGRQLPGFQGALKKLRQDKLAVVSERSLGSSLPSKPGGPRALGIAPEPVNPLGKAEFADTMPLVAQDLQKAQEQLSIASISGGKGHLSRRSSRSVISLSRHSTSVR